MGRRRKRGGNWGDLILAVLFISIAFSVLGNHSVFVILLPILILIIFVVLFLLFLKFIIKSVNSELNPSENKYSNKIRHGYNAPYIGKADEALGLRPTCSSINDIKQEPTAWSLDLLQELEWKRFEEVTAEYYRIQGFDAKTTRIGADGGIDIVLRKDGLDKPIAVVQCKAHKNNIGIKPIRELYGVMAAEKIENGVFITTSDYTSEAIQFADEKKMLLLSGKDFIQKINNLNHEQKSKLLDFATHGDYITPTCPRCDIKMIIKTRRKDGGEFWGCQNYRPYGRGCSQIFNFRQ
jgi:restriction system protein